MPVKVYKSRKKVAKNDNYTPVKTAGSTWPERATPKFQASSRSTTRKYVTNNWRKNVSGESMEYQGIQVFATVDPYTNTERQDFRSANDNAYVYRANRIMTSFVAGQGYTTDVVPRGEEDMPSDQEENWASTTKLSVPYWQDKEFTPEQIKDWIDKLCLDLDLQTNIDNGYYVALEQGRCVLALTPLDKDPDETKAVRWKIPETIRLIRPEFTMRPIIDDNSAELKACQVVGAYSDTNNSELDAERMIYIMHGFNNELFSDCYGDSKVARISDIANTLNVILNQDYPNTAKSAWYKPPVFSVPIPPQEFGNEQTILTNFANTVNESEGRAAAVTGPSNKDEIGITMLDPGSNKADVGGLDLIRTGLIKSIITAYGIPGFMLSEGDIGALSGNSNIEEMDMYINTEIRPERLQLEKVIESQLYDRILQILFQCENTNDLPIKMKHKFNKPKLFTMLDPALYNELKDMVAIGLIDEGGLREFLGIEELDKDTMTQGNNTDPDLNRWRPAWKTPMQINLWPDANGNINSTTSSWGQVPNQWESKQNGTKTLPRGWKS